jgi:phenylacetic acid degradation operon negative regulatory protein
MRTTAKRALLQLLSAARPLEVPAAVLVAAGEVLGFSENNVRVTLARLVAAGTVEIGARGVYRLGQSASVLGEQVRGWRDLERQVRRWDGGWTSVFVGDLSRTDRAALARRERALRLLGFRPLARGLEVRPDNLEGGAPAIRARLHALGLEPSAPVFRAEGFDVDTEGRARALWESERLTGGYKQTRERIQKWLAVAGDLTPEIAAREAFHFGGEVLRRIIFDPRLPEPLVDVGERRAMLEAARKLDVFGRRLWARLFGTPHGLVATTEEEHERIVLQ